MRQVWFLMLVMVVGILYPLDIPALFPLARTASQTTDTQAIIDRLLQTPILYNVDTQAVKEVFQHGQELGNRADVFTKVGDSNTTSGDFLLPMGDYQRNCELGTYTYLQATLDRFSVSYDGGGSNAFTRNSVAAQNGLSSSAALDPMWAGDTCNANENPVACEYRLARPSIAIIMLGLMDVRYQTEVEVFRTNLEQIVQYSLDQGVIPVLTTLVVLPNQETLSYDLSLVYNAVMLDLADAYQIPLINLWAAVQGLPDMGIGPDRTHLKHRVGAFCDFSGAETEVGGTLRNLLTLQALDALVQAVFTP